jgi:hypothetical protein
VVTSGNCWQQVVEPTLQRDGSGTQVVALEATVDALQVFDCLPNATQLGALRLRHLNIDCTDRQRHARWRARRQWLAARGDRVVRAQMGRAARQRPASRLLVGRSCLHR